MEWKDDHEFTFHIFDPEDIRIESKVYSVKYLLDLIQDNTVNLSAEFNRHSVWNNRQKSLLIESLLLRIPLPSFYFYEDDDWNLHIIDGVQRLIAIYEFMNNKFSLSHLDILRNCNGAYVEDLPHKYIYRILQTQVQVNVIDSRTPKEIHFEILRRLNTGGSSLTAQELRNTVAKRPTRELLNELSDIWAFNQIIGEIDNKRFQKQELVLRFLAFYRAYDWEEKQLYYHGGVNTFLDYHFKEINNESMEELEMYKSAFVKAVENMYVLFDSSSIIINIRRNKNLLIVLLVLMSHYETYNILNIDTKHLQYEVERYLSYSRNVHNNRQFYNYFEDLRRIIGEVSDYA